MRTALLKERMAGHTIGFVPTLGYLHEGHESLIAKARKENDIVVVSAFVNPKQFRTKAYQVYPRDLARDKAICERLKVNYVFAPENKDMHPDGYDTEVSVKELTGRLEGSKIRWHYKAVATVVAKLFNIVGPDRAYFGKKDPHQLAIIKRMTADLNFPVKIVPVTTKRAKDGVALSSRNALLTKEERKAAVVIPNAIKEIARLIKKGGVTRTRLVRNLESLLVKEPIAKVDFIAVVDADTLREEDFKGKTLIYVAVYIGDKRLTDNVVV